MKFLNGVEFGNGGAVITDCLVGSFSINLPSVAANSASDTNSTLTGAANGDVCIFAPPASPLDGQSTRHMDGFATATNTVRTRFTNTGESAVDLGSFTYKFLIIKFA